MIKKVIRDHIEVIAKHLYVQTYKCTRCKFVILHTDNPIIYAHIPKYFICVKICRGILTLLKMTQLGILAYKEDGKQKIKSKGCKLIYKDRRNHRKSIVQIFGSQNTVLCLGKQEGNRM